MTKAGVQVNSNCIRKRTEETKVAVLMATFNGIDWIAEQVDSILNQSDVNLTLYISDDCSSDGTYDYLQELEKGRINVILVRNNRRLGSAGKNFYRLIQYVDASSFDYIAFSDQDDIWDRRKIFNQISLINRNDAQAVSSNVVAFWQKGRKILVRKSQPQKKYDFLFESGGPGCTILMTSWLLGQIKHQLIVNHNAIKVEMHDWLAYAICRALKKKWLIDKNPTLLYRQHKSNVIGVNSGFLALNDRLKKVSNGWYRSQLHLISAVVYAINKDENIAIFNQLVKSKSVFTQFMMLPFVIEGRRKKIDRLFLILSLIFFIF